MGKFVFRSSQDNQWFAVTFDGGGTALPKALGPWERLARHPLTKQALHDIESSARIRQVLQRDGFYLVRSPPLHASVIGLER